MITPECGDDPAVRSIVELKRQLIELKLEALLRSGETGPTTDVHDLDAVVDEVVAGLEERRAPTLTSRPEQPTSSNR